MMAARKGRANLMTLIASGARLDVWNAAGKTALFFATSSDNTDGVQFLLQSGADIDIVDSLRNTPISEAAAIGSPNVVRMLLNYGAEFDSLNKFGHTPLYRAARPHANDVDREKKERAKSFSGSSGRNDKAEEDYEALMSRNYRFRETYGRYEKPTDFERLVVARLLLQAGANADFRDNDGYTADHWATYYGYHAMAAMLRKARTSPGSII